MAYNIYKSSAWQTPSATKRYANGAWQSCESAKRYVSGAWQNVWNSAVYFLKSGVLQDGASLNGMGFRKGSGYIYMDADEDTGYQKGAIQLAITSDMVGKTLYVKASSNISTSTYAATYLVFGYPIAQYSTKQVAMTTKSSDGCLTVTIPSDYYFNSSNQTTLWLTNEYYGITPGTYYIYDIYIA